MKKLLLRVIYIIALSLVMPLLTIENVLAETIPRYESSGMEFIDETPEGRALYNNIKVTLPRTPDGGIVPQWKQIQGAKLYINYRLWQNEGVLCYGNYKNVPGNNFKAGTQVPGNPEMHGINDGYYSNPYSGSNRGEWRYHGYDVSGNKLSNIFFIPDSIVTKFDERNWIKEPWINLPDSKVVPSSSFNNAATGYMYDNSIKSGVQSWINKSMEMYTGRSIIDGEVTSGVPLPGNVVDPEVYYYLNVESAPTIMRPGQGRMWHKRPNDSIWYQTVVVPRLEPNEKDNLPVTVTIVPLTVLPEITDLGSAMDSINITLKFKITAALDDTAVYNDAVKSTVYYTRNDINSWSISLTGPGQPINTQNNISPVNNTGSFLFEYTTTYKDFRAHNWSLYFTASAAPKYKDNITGNTGHASHTISTSVKDLPDLPVQIIEFFAPMPSIPETAFDGVAFSAADNTDMTDVEERRVFIDGVEVDDTKFFSGNYLFTGEVCENGRFIYVDCKYRIKNLPPETGEIITRDVVYIYPTKPSASFKISSNTWKQNRLINIQNNSTSGNISIVLQKYPIVQYEWTYGGNTLQLRKGTDTDLAKELLYKAPGIYSLSLRCKNSLGKWSDPYNVTFQVLEDVAPAVGVNLNESVYTRNDKVSAWYYSIASTDGDVITSSSIQLWYDSNNDGTLDQKLNTWNNQAQFPDYTPAKLGYYKYIVTALEDFTTDTLSQYITAADKKSASYSVEFWVDNYQPLSDIYVNIPIQRPNIDVYFMLDKNLDQSKKDYILNNRVNMSNWLLGKNMVPSVNIWDMRSYTYSQAAGTSLNTGSSYPPVSTTYSSNGYSGTLSLTSTSNNRYSVDYGHYGSKTESKTATGTATGWSEVYYTAGRWGGWVKTGEAGSTTPSISYSDAEGYSGTLYKTSYIITKDNGAPAGTGTPGSTYTWHREYLAYYSGTVTRTVQVWVPNIVWYDNYTGYYAGTIYKSVRQPYTDTFSPTSLKYVIYISDSTISELNDLSMVMGYAKSAKLFLAGTSTIKTQHAYDQYFDVSDKTIDTVANEILQYVADGSPAIEKYCVLQDEAFSMNVGELDLENDAIINREMQYVHDRAYFDNPTGTEPGTVMAYSDTAGWINSSDPSAVKSTMHNVGKYTIYRRVKDNPSTDPNFSNFSYYSSPTALEVYVVRKPVAKATLDWDYDISSSTYKTTWVDQSYDPDHQYSRPDKGIIDRNIMWRKSGGEWYYGIPDNLAYGSYELNYYVKDLEGYWSNPFIMNFTLEPAPSIQFDASLRTLDSKFNLEQIPASEKLEAFNMWTRYPYNIRLEMALYNGNTRATPLKIINYGTSTGVKTNNDINWNNVIYQIPDILPDRSYEFRISAVSDDGKTAVKCFSVNVTTPIDLMPSIPEVVMGGTNAMAGATTSKYADTVNVTLFQGTAYEVTWNLSVAQSGGTDKSWEGSMFIPSNIPEGEYKARFKAIAANGTFQTKDLNFKLQNLSITNVSISGYWNHWRGQVDILGERLTNEPHRFLSLERVKIDITTLGNPDTVTIRFSPELEAMSFTDPNGNVYEYGDDYFGYEVEFPGDSTFIPDGDHVHWEYNLPLAPSTKDWRNNRLRPAYKIIVTAYKGGNKAEYVINDIEITGNIYDLTYIQPKE